MMFNFDKIFEKIDYDWSKVNLTDNPPCAKCEHLWISQHGATIEQPPKECDHCVRRINYITDCLLKLQWYESKEKQSSSSDGLFL